MKPTYPTENSVVLMQFRQFCSELLRLRQRVEQRYPPSPPSATGPAVTAQPLADPLPGNQPVGQDASVWPQNPLGGQSANPTEEVRQSLIALLEQQSQRFGELGGALGLGLYREAEYVMAALADEIFLNARWSERTRWPLLEQEIFHTHVSGDLFFQKLDRLLTGNSANSNDLAMIYFQALALDFRGRYRGSDPHRHLERYRRQLYVRIFRHPPEEGAREPIFLETYDSTADESQSLRLPSPHLWWLVLAGVCALWLMGSTLLWNGLTSPVKQQVEQIRSSSKSFEDTSR